jgi:predicted lipoprotein
MQRAHRSPRPARLIGLGLLVVLLVAMVLNTKFLDPAELAAAGPVKFDPKATADELFTRAKAELPDKASEVGDVVPAMQSDTKSAAEKYKAVSPAEGAYVFPVKTTGTVTEATEANLRLKITGVPEETPVIVPLTTAINGTVIRDVMGFKFADAPGQTDYQYVGDELKKLMQAEVKDATSDPASLKGKKITVVGAISVIGAGTSVPKPKPVNIQPLSIKATS